MNSKKIIIINQDHQQIIPGKSAEKDEQRTSKNKNQKFNMNKNDLKIK